MALKLHCWGANDGQIAEIDISTKVINILREKYQLDLEIIPDSSFYTSKLPYLESDEGPISDLATIFQRILPRNLSENDKNQIEQCAILKQGVYQMERVMLYVLYEEKYIETRRIHAKLNKWPFAYYPPIWMKRWTQRVCGDLIEPDEIDDSTTPIIHEIQKKDQERKKDLRMMKSTLRCDALLNEYKDLNEVTILFANCIEQYRSI